MKSPDNFLWDIEELLKALNPVSCSDDIRTLAGVSSISIDSKLVKPSGLFFAIKGDKNDGHDYVDQAFDNGASAAVVSRGKISDYSGKHVFVVDDTYDALISLSKAARARFKGKTIEITGSVGKTTTKEMLAHLIGLQSHCYASPKSFNNRYGVPITLVNIPKDFNCAIVEAGMNNFGELKDLTELICPDISFISSIFDTHIGNFGSLMNIARAKSEVFSRHKGDGVALLSGDSPFFDFLSGVAKSQGIKEIFSFGSANWVDSKVIEVCADNGSLLVTASVFGHEVRYRLDTLGDHWVNNSVAVLALIHLVGCDIEKAAEDFFSFKPMSGRGKRQRVKMKSGTEFLLIDESYNASPESMAAALRSLGRLNANGPDAGRRIAIIADMGELGDQSIKSHLSLLPIIDKYNIDAVFACGDLMHHLYKLIPAPKRGGWFPSCDSLLSDFSLENYIRGGDIIMVKGSHYMGSEKIVSQLLKLQNDI